jgi:ABC-2 type transport system ATP-binding protein
MLRIKNLTKKYGSKMVLDDVSMDFLEGEVTCLLGLNGVGKSTTMKAIMGLIPYSKGFISLDGKIISNKNIDQLAYVPDVAIHDLGYTALKNLDFCQDFYPNFNMEKALKLIDYFKLPTDRKLKELSKGNLARFNLICGLAQDAKFLILDEPFSGIDVFTRENFIKALKNDFLKPEQGVIITTHEINEIQDVADRIILLEHGKVYATFTKKEALKEGLSIVDKMRAIYKGEA